ncbi:MAG: SLOG family protein [Bacillota bacterium]|nr:SLOG family protein [Bacillota bacterium]
MSIDTVTDDRKISCCFTGHRDIPHDMRIALAEKLEAEIERLQSEGVKCFLAGGALGFDTVAAESVLRVRKRHPQIQLGLVLPCVTQTRYWRKSDVENYNHIKQQADSVVYTAQEYHDGCMHVRNRYLVDHSGTCICYFTGGRGGTAYTVEYARKSGLKVVNLHLEKHDKESEWRLFEE